MIQGVMTPWSICRSWGSNIPACFFGGSGECQKCVILVSYTNINLPTLQDAVYMLILAHPATEMGKFPGHWAEWEESDSRK